MNELKILRDNFMNCKKCENFPFGAVLGETDEKKDIMLVGLSPLSERENTAFKGEEGKTLDLLLSILNLKRNDVYLTYLIKCFLKDKEKAEACGNICIEHLRNETRIIRPKIIICFGDIVSKKLISKNFNPYTDCGKPVTKGGITFFGVKELSALTNVKRRTEALSYFQNIREYLN